MSKEIVLKQENNQVSIEKGTGNSFLDDVFESAVQQLVELKIPSTEKFFHLYTFSQKQEQFLLDEYQRQINEGETPNVAKANIVANVNAGLNTLVNILGTTAGAITGFLAGGTEGGLIGARFGGLKGEVAGAAYGGGTGFVVGGVAGGLLTDDFYNNTTDYNGTTLAQHVSSGTSTAYDFVKEQYENFSSSVSNFKTDVANFFDNILNDNSEPLSSSSISLDEDLNLSFLDDTVYFEGSNISISTLSDEEIAALYDSYAQFGPGKHTVSLVTKDTVTSTEEDKILAGIDVEEMNEEMGGMHFDPNEATSFTVTGINGEDKKYSVFDSDTQTNIEGQNYLLRDVVDSITSAGEALTEFVTNQADLAYKNVTEGTAYTSSFIQFVDAFKDDFANGTISADEAVEEYAKLLANNFLQIQVTGTLTSEERFNYIRDALAAELDIDNDQAGKIADSLISSIAQMAGTFATQSQGWDGEDFAKAGTAIAVNAIYNYVLQEYLSEIPGVDILGNAGISIITSLINSGEVADEQWEDIGITVAFGSYAQLFDGNALEITVNVVKEAVSIALSLGNPVIKAGINLALNIFQGSVYQGKVYYEGEFGDLQELLNTIYTVQQIDDGNGNMVDALVATNPNGSTIVAQGITHIVGQSGQDVLVGNEDLDDIISGNSGSDYIEGQSGDDTLMGGAGNDHITGGIGNDIVQGGLGNDVLFGDEGDDTLLANEGNDFIHGGSGNDTIDSGAGNDTVLGGGGDDAITTGSGEDMIDSGAGDDVIDSGDDDDIVIGNFGNDLISLGNGEDIAFGAEDNDTIIAGAGADFIDGGIGTDILQGENGDDLISGGQGNDFLEGGLGDDDLVGGTGDDSISGGMDNDFLYGEAGNDELNGSFGDDILYGGAGSDILNGGEGSDTYVISNAIDDTDNQISDDSGANDFLVMSWLTESEANSNLTLKQDANNLIIEYNGERLATINDHFNGKQIEKLEIEQGKTIDLTALTIGSGGVASFAISASNSNSVDDIVQARIDDAYENYQTKEQFWNNAFIQSLSQEAYEEALRDQVENEYYNGSEVATTYRNRGKFGGKYTVYKVVENGVLEGQPDIYKYTLLDQNSDTSIFDEVINGEKASLEYTKSVSHNAATGELIPSTIKYEINDYWVDNQVISSEENTFMLKNTYAPSLGYNLVSGNVIDSDFYAFSGYVGYQYYVSGQLASAQSRKPLANISVVEFGKQILQENTGDKLVGSWWEETLIGESGDDILIGNGGNDTLDGGTGDDWIFGGDGDDTIYGKEGYDVGFGDADNDTIYGGLDDDALAGSDGDDFIYGEDGNDWIDGGQGVDQIEGGVGDDIIFAGDGNDVAKGQDGRDIIYGQNGNDTIYGGLGDDVLYGRQDDDTIYGEEGNDKINGNQGQDHIYGGAGDDVLRGGIGYDTIYSGEGNNSIDGGDGIDRVTYELSQNEVSIDLETNSSTIGSSLFTDSISNIEYITGSDFDDSIKGNAVDNVLIGGAGDDLVIGRAGDDTLSGGIGSDTMYGGVGEDNVSGNDGNDTIFGWTGSDTIDGGAGDDNINGEDDDDIIHSGEGNNTIDGGAGIDSLTYESSQNEISIDLNTNSSTIGNNLFTDSVTNIENITGSDSNDSIKGDTSDNLLTGMSGDDLIIGRAGDDTLNGGLGVDTIYGGIGEDTISGDSGDDILYGWDGNDFIDGGEGNDTIRGEADNDELRGNDGADTLYGGSGADTIYGQSGNDILYGEAENDLMFGGTGNDQIYGGAGDDKIFGKAGQDYMQGGTGVDVFVFDDLTHSTSTEMDIIGDFEQGSDIIDLKAFSFSSVNDFTIQQNANETIIEDNSSAFALKLNGSYALTDADFLFT